MMVTLSQAQFKTAQVNYHIETVFSETSIAFNTLYSMTSSYRYSSSIFERGKRSIANCKGFGNILIYDIDNDKDNILLLSTAIEMFKDISSLIVTTKSHNQQKNGLASERYRIMVPLDSSISIGVDDYSHYYLHVASVLGIEVNIDHACKDAARMYQPNHCQKVHYSQSEIVLSELKLRISFEEKKFLENSTREVFIADTLPVHSDSKIEYLRSILQTQSLLNLLKYEEKFVQGNRNNYLYSVGCYLIDNYLSKSEVRDTLIWMNSLKFSLNELELDRTVMRSLKI